MFRQLIRTLQTIKAQYYNINPSKFGKHGEHVDLEMPMQINKPTNIEVGDDICIRSHFLFISHTGKLIIKSHSMLAQHVTVITGNHSLRPPKDLWQSDVNKMDSYNIEKDVMIEEDCWIGAHVTILSGVTIGRGSIIGAGAVVTKNIPPYSIAVGNPCRVIKKKYTYNEIIERELSLYPEEQRLSSECVKEICDSYS